MSEQAFAALRKANKVRKAGAGFRREVKEKTPREGAALVSEALAEEDERIQALTLERTLRAIQSFGPKRVGRMLSAYNIGPRRKIRDLTVRQRAIIAASLRVWAQRGGSGSLLSLARR